MRRSLGTVRILAIALVPVACGGDAGEGAGAGDRAEVREFRLSSKPVATIGVVGGDPAYELFDVRAAVRLRDGRTVVANRGTSDLRYYDAQGRHLATVGREGEGPGEFDDLRYATPIRGDTIVTWDYGQRRVSFFDEEGDLAHTIPVDISSRSVGLFGASGPAMPAGVVARHDGTLFVRPTPPVWLARQSPPADGTHRPEYQLYELGRDGAITDSIGPLEGEEYLIHEGMVTGRPVAHRFLLAAGNELVFTGSGLAYRFGTSGAGPQVDTVSIPRPRGVLTDDYRQRWIDFAVENYFGGQQAVRERYEAAPKADSLPAYADLVADAEDRVWIGEYRESLDGGPVEPRAWSVYDRTGRLLGSITMPEGLEVTHIGFGFVTGVVTDELDVETVQVYRLLDFP